MTLELSLSEYDPFIEVTVLDGRAIFMPVLIFACSLWPLLAVLRKIGA